VHQDKYTNDLIKKFNMAELKPVPTLMSTATSLDPDEDDKVVDQREYRSMIDSLLYLTTTRPYIQFIVCFFTLFTSDNSSMNLQVPQTHS
jgi:hypothetical protein